MNASVSVMDEFYANLTIPDTDCDTCGPSFNELSGYLEVGREPGCYQPHITVIQED